ncbi:MAG: HK97 gp10 family phage protein [Sporichthyaceae bacterium]|nr:HK97 gp10 family phage protein [Sporichthyaceae bacterium]
MPRKVKIRGLRELQRVLDRLAGDVRDAAADAVREAAEAVQRREQATVATDTGTLRDGIEIRYSDDGRTAEVGVFDPDLYYAEFVEYGTSTAPEQPFARPAAEAARTEFPGTVTDVVRRKALP